MKVGDLIYCKNTVFIPIFTIGKYYNIGEIIIFADFIKIKIIDNHGNCIWIKDVIFNECFCTIRKLRKMKLKKIINGKNRTK